jgi:hypothetical protein
MPAHYPVPIQEDIRDLLVNLLGRTVAVDKVSPLVLEDDTVAAVAEYVTDDDRPDALAVLDSRFAVRAGAALVMVPSNVAEQDLKAKELPESHLENVQEVLNVLSRLLNSEGSPHLRLRAVHRLPGDLPAGVADLLDHPEFRRDFAVFIEGYGDGRFSLLVN